MHGVREETSKGRAGVAPRNREGDSLKQNLTGILFLLCIQDCSMLKPHMHSCNICLSSMTNILRKRFNTQLEPKRDTWNLGIGCPGARITLFLSAGEETKTWAGLAIGGCFWWQSDTVCPGAARLCWCNLLWICCSSPISRWTCQASV